MFRFDNNIVLWWLDKDAFCVALVKLASSLVSPINLIHILNNERNHDGIVKILLKKL